jgi:hypothetical protein
MGEPRASYSLPVDGERVLSVSGDVVVTRNGSLTVEYRGVTGRYAVGDLVTEPVRHRTRVERRTWSPFDGEEDD